MYSLPVVLRQGAAAAQRAAGKGKIADLLQQCTRDQHAFGLLNLRSIHTTSASLDSDDGKPGISGTIGKCPLIHSARCTDCSETLPSSDYASIYLNLLQLISELYMIGI